MGATHDWREALSGGALEHIKCVKAEKVVNNRTLFLRIEGTRMAFWKADSRDGQRSSQ